MTGRLRGAAAAAAWATVLGGCANSPDAPATIGPERPFCEFATITQLADISADNLRVSIALPTEQGSAQETFMILSRPRGFEPVMRVSVTSTSPTLPPSRTLDNCPGTSTRTYAPTDLTDVRWNDYWTRFGEGDIEVGLATGTEKIQIERFGMVVFDYATNQSSVTCGCLRTPDRQARGTTP